MCYVYILKSEKDNNLYIGSTKNLEGRLLRHFQGRSSATSHRLPLSLIASEQFTDRKQALARERYLKNLKNPVYVMKIVGR